MVAWNKQKKSEFRETHPFLMPVQQVYHNAPHGDLKAYFDIIFNADHPEYKGMVTVVAMTNDASTPKIVAVVPADQLGDWADQMHVSTRLDYYYSKGQHRGNATWGTEGVFAFNAIYVDIDCHNDDDAVTTPVSLVDYVVYGLADAGIPAPNIIERSGRGYHLVWCIDQVAAALGWMVRAVSQHFAETIGDLLLSGGFRGYCVDQGYSANIAGLTRVPGTYNTSARNYASCEILHRIRMDLPKIYDSIPCSEGFHSKVEIEMATLGEKRTDALLLLAKIRPIVDGQRDLYCLHLFSATQLAGMSNNAALDIVKDLNSTFPNPLRESEVENYLSTAGRKHYKFTTKRIIGDLCITCEEQAKIGLVASKRDSNRARKARNAEKKTCRDKKIMRLHILGHSCSAIARMVGHAYNTVRVIIAKFENCLEKLFSIIEMKKLLQEKTQAEAKATMRKIKCFISKVRKVKATHKSKTAVFKFRRTIYYAYNAFLAQPDHEPALDQLTEAKPPGY